MEIDNNYLLQNMNNSICIKDEGIVKMKIKNLVNV